MAGTVHSTFTFIAPFESFGPTENSYVSYVPPSREPWPGTVAVDDWNCLSAVRGPVGFG